MGIPVAFFVSGAAALILQVLWARLLGHVLGSSALAISTVLTVFMAGLALGSHLGGRFAPRLRRPYLAFAILEAVVGLYGLAVPGLLDAIVQIQATMVSGASFGGYALFRFSMAALVLAIPTVCMGASLPVLAQGWIRAGEGSEETGHLYAANTLGAVAGAAVAGFLAIPHLGVTRTVWLAAGLDLAVALGVGLGHPWFSRRPRARRPDDVLRLELAEAPVALPADARRLIIFTYGLTGAFSMALEVLWSRAVGVVIGASTYSFTVILTAYLLGLAAGAAVMTRFMHRVRSVSAWVAGACALAGLGVLVSHRWIDALPLALHRQLLERGVTQFDLHTTNFVLALAVTLPSTMAFGALMPLAVRGAEGDDGPGRTVGRIYAANTVGCILGSFAGGFVLLPVMGLERSIWGLGIGLVVWGIVVVARDHRAGVRPVAALAVAGAVLAVTAPAWDYARWTAGLFRPYVALGVHGDGWSPNAEVIHHRDGVATSVTVDRNPDSGSVALKVNGKVDASDRGDMPTQVLSGLFPLLAHPDPRTALVIGYGSGVTPGAMLQSDLERVVVAEIEAAVYEASNQYFGHVNHRPDRDERAELIVDDGRNLLLTRAERFDVIVSEPSNPWMSGAASLFTRDFFEIAATRLQPGGVFLQWLQAYELSPRNVEVLLRTFHSVFPHVAMLTPDPNANDTFLLGSMAPIELRFERLQRWFRDPALSRELQRARVDTPHDLVALLVADEEAWSDAVPAGPINTDDNALIEFRAPFDLLEYAVRDPSIPIVYRAAGRRRELARHLVPDLPDDPETRLQVARALLWRGLAADAQRYARLLPASSDERSRIERLASYVSNADAESALVVDAQTRGDRAYAEAAWAVVQGRDEEALAIVEREPVGFEERSPAHQFLYAYLCYRADRHLDAEYLFDLVLDDDRFVARHPAVLYYAGRTQLFRGRLDPALDFLSRYDDARWSERVEPSAELAPKKG